MLTILTLNWNGAEKLSRLHQTLLPCLEGIEFNWHIKDNGSSDTSLDLIRNWGDERIHLLTCPHNRDSFAKGMNVLFESSKPEDNVLLLNNDVVFNDTTSIKKMMELLKDDVGVVGARLLYTGTDKLQHAGVIFSERYNRLPYHFRPGEKTDQVAERNREFQVVTGAVLLTKASCYAEIGGMDENFRWAFDDVDLCLSIKYKLGKKIIYCGQTNICHDESHSLKKNPVNKLFMNSNVSYFRKKWDGKYEIDHERYLKNPSYNEY